MHWGANPGMAGASRTFDGGHSGGNSRTHPGRFWGVRMLGLERSLKEGFERRTTAIEQEVMAAMPDKTPTAAKGSESTPLQHVFNRRLVLS